eukprot:TRINITY_DN3992_c0_g1_i1.p1 TRINITY_DN3992_c0_g1~~TRINITY_DN3992_c0_g1_i1.p1  ORF type:complete len:382 (-),score=115.53 TRINITY_DN3992_c0_g1_i1:36-1181(-)
MKRSDSASRGGLIHRGKSKEDDSTSEQQQLLSKPPSPSPPVKEHLLLDLNRLRKILGPCRTEDLDDLQETLTWPHKPEPELDAEWTSLCSDYSKLTGSDANSDGLEKPSISDVCYYINHWAVKFAEVGNALPTDSGLLPKSLPHWAKNQVLLYADNGKLCPPCFKEELDHELFYLLHHANSLNLEDEEGEDDDEYDPENHIYIDKVKVMLQFFFFGGKDITQVFSYLYEEYEKRLRRGLISEQTTPFVDLFYERANNFRTGKRHLIDEVKSFVIECEKMMGRSFEWNAPLKQSAFKDLLPTRVSSTSSSSSSSSPPDSSSAPSSPSSTIASVQSTCVNIVAASTSIVSPQASKKMTKIMKTVSYCVFAILLVTMFSILFIG